MRSIAIGALKNRLSEVLRWVQRGQTVVVLDRGVSIAKIERVTAAETGKHGALDRLVRDGVVTAASSSSRPRWLDQPAIRCSGDIVEALIEERDSR
jgi:antitoxin (DNA-binding transcriptional repressor) of toxin-antitoxin stability system